jgi:hypothetical protein
MLVIADVEALSTPELPLLMLYVIDDVVRRCGSSELGGGLGREPDPQQAGLGGLRGRGGPGRDLPRLAGCAAKHGHGAVSTLDGLAVMAPFYVKGEV